MQLLRANTAVDVLIGPFVDDADGDTPATGLTLDVELSKNGQALTDSESAAPTHDAAGTVDGYYNCILGTTDTNTEGQLVLVVHHADALPIRHEYMVMAEAAWDSMFAAKDTGFMDVNIKTVGQSGTDETAANNLEDMFDGTGYAGGTIKLTVDAVKWLGQALAAVNVNGVPKMDLTHMGGVTQSAADLKDFADDGYDPANNKVQSDLIYIHGTALTETAGQLAAAFIKLFNVATPALVASDVMRGNDSANTTTPPTVSEIQTEMEEDGASLLDTIRDVVNNLPNSGALTDIGNDTARLTAARAGVLTDWINGNRLDNLLDAIPTTAMRGTENAATETKQDAAKIVVDAIKTITDALPNAGALSDIGTATARLTAVRAAVLTDWINAGRLDVILDAIKLITDIIGNNVVSGTASGTPTTTTMVSDIAITHDDQFNGRLITFRDNTTTVALRGQQTAISASLQADDKFTFTGLTVAPSSGDKFDIS